MLNQQPSASECHLSDWLAGQHVDDRLADIVLLLADGAVELASVLREAPLRGHDKVAGPTNVHGEEQKKLDIIGHDIVVSHLGSSPHVAAMVSEEVEQLIIPDGAERGAPYAVCFDPLDGSSNLAINGTVGTIFSILTLGSTEASGVEANLLASAFNQAAAGYVLYGPATLLVLTTGETVASFALDDATGRFVLVDAELKIPSSASEYAINIAHARFWEAPVATYVEDCLHGEDGPHGKPFNMRWSGAMVADVHRLFIQGGIFIYPLLSKPGGESGKLRFLYEANPMAFLVEVAGGRAIARAEPLRSIVPDHIHQRVPVALGSRNEVVQLASLYVSK